MVALFSEYVLNPAMINAADTAHLDSLSNKFPCCQLLHAFICRSSLGEEIDFGQRLSKAALYSPDRNMLHAIVNRPGSLLIVEMRENWDYQILDTYAETKRMTEERMVNTPFLVIEEPFADIPMESTTQHEPELNTEADDFAIEPTFEIHVETKALIAERRANSSFLTIEEYPATPAKTDTRQEGGLEGITIEDYAEQLVDPAEEPIIITEQHHSHKDVMIGDKTLDSQEVSKYDDDRMPYSFLWWLNKTRKEHAGIYQPYVKAQSNLAETKKHVAEGLGYQIAENIFYQQLSPLKDLENQGVDPNQLTFKRKEESILDKFIQDDPQIKPPKPESLSIENKARHSAQDLDDLVSETLAEIYTGQMLFDKAIDTYKKLSLKFPEKSAYFGELIHDFEKKINK